MTVTVAVDGVEKSYGAVKALRNVSFDLGPGRLNALVGHNGAGKTTLIKLMLGLIHAERGAVRVLNEDPAAGQFSARRQLGYLPENVAFNAALTGRETLAFYARLKQINPASAWPRRCWGGRACCCWMSRPRGSIPRCVKPSTRSSTNCATTAPPS